MQIPFLTGSSGPELNFEIVGGSSRPENPKPNTIWINTDQEITGWTFRDDEPSEPVDGLVWIESNKDSYVKFNALTEKNEIQLCPIKVRLYTSGAWNDNVFAQLYSDGSWNDMIIYLFKDGNHYSNITGGWVNTTGFTFNSSNTAQGTVTIGETIKCKTGTGQSAYASTANKIDVSDYRNIVVCVSDLGSKTYELTLMPSAGNMADKAVAFKKLSDEDTILPIKDVDGSYYICVGTAGGETIEVTQIYLER